MMRDSVSWKGLQHRWIFLGMCCAVRAERTLDACREGARHKAGISGRGEVEVGWGGSQLEPKFFDAKNRVFFFFSFYKT